MNITQRPNETEKAMNNQVNESIQDSLKWNEIEESSSKEKEKIDRIDRLENQLSNLKKKNDEFYLSLIHNLNGHARTIESFCDILSDESLTAENSEEYLGFIKNSSLKISHLVSGIADQRNLENELLNNKEVKSIDLNKLFLRLNSHLSHYLKSANTEMSVKSHLGSTDGNIFALFTMMSNLIKNLELGELEGKTKIVVSPIIQMVNKGIKLQFTGTKDLSCWDRIFDNSSFFTEFKKDEKEENKNYLGLNSFFYIQEVEDYSYYLSKKEDNFSRDIFIIFG